LVEAARTLAAILAELSGTGTPLEAAKAWKQAHLDREASMPFGEAVPLFLATRDGLRIHTVRGYTWHLTKVLSPLHGLILADITAADMNAALSARSPQVRRAVNVTLGTFWRWAASAARSWCNTLVLEGLDPVRVTNDTEITCFTPEEAQAILRGAWPKNVCRHTCASTQIAIGTPLDDLTFKFGHAGGAVMLKQHYLGKLMKKDALELLAIGPNNSKISSIEAAPLHELDAE